MAKKSSFGTVPARTLPSDVRLSANQHLVWKQLKNANAPLSAYQILKKVNGKGISAPQQVYRALERLIEIGVVHRLESVSRYVACTQKAPHPYQDSLFAICNHCGRAFEFKAKKALKQIHNKAFEQDFTTGQDPY
ncbi:MAG: transcriptional repressor [Alphaproteobacteria bacterium]|nr:transcriptional repressor [Alphaproteobacteria bacterium]